jgi:signal recognition particle GTPase
MDELRKIVRVLKARRVRAARLRALMDAGLGQNAIRQVSASARWSTSPAWC